jgi:hypothetical protein
LGGFVHVDPNVCHFVFFHSIALRKASFVVVIIIVIIIIIIINVVVIAIIALVVRSHISSQMVLVCLCIAQFKLGGLLLVSSIKTTFHSQLRFILFFCAHYIQRAIYYPLKMSEKSKPSFGIYDMQWIVSKSAYTQMYYMLMNADDATTTRQLERMQTAQKAHAALMFLFPSRPLFSNNVRVFSLSAAFNAEISCIFNNSMMIILIIFGIISALEWRSLGRGSI